MGNEFEEHEAWISYLDEENKTRQGFVIIVYFDSSFVKFRTDGKNIIIIPTARILKIKYPEENKKRNRK